MPKVPRIDGNAAVRAFEKAGFVVVRQAGSHQIMKKRDHPSILSIPVHRGKDVGTGLLASQIKAAGLTVEEFRKLL